MLAARRGTTLGPEAAARYLELMGRLRQQHEVTSRGGDCGWEGAAEDKAFGPENGMFGLKNGVFGPENGLFEVKKWGCLGSKMGILW